MSNLLITIVHAAGWLFTLLVIADVIMSYFVSPYHPVRLFLDRIVQPMLRPIQRMMPSMMGIDFSPMVLLLLIQLLESVIVGILGGIR